MRVNEAETKRLLEAVKPAKLVAATKYIDEKEVEKLEECGVMIYGENKVQDFLKKYEDYHGKGVWHFIGTLQTNKVKYIIDKVQMIHSVANYRLIDEIEKQAAKHNYLKDKPHLNPRGLMMMAPNIEVEETRQYFKATKDLLTKLQESYPNYQLTELSMGMTHDFPIAVAEGSTMVRLGHALFDE